MIKKILVEPVKYREKYLSTNLLTKRRWNMPWTG